MPAGMRVAALLFSLRQRFVRTERLGSRSRNAATFGRTAMLLWSLVPLPAIAGLNLWTPIGPESGPVEAVAIDPTNPAIVYACTFGGVFTSVDGGGTWNRSSTGYSCYSNAYGCSLAIDPVTPTTIYAAKQSVAGVCKSTDGGATWSKSALPNSVSALAVNPSSPNIIYAGGSPTAFYRSTDGGVTWSPATAGLGSSYVNAIAVNPVNPAIVYTGGNGLFRSADGGATWAATGISGFDIEAVALDPLTPTTVYASRGLNGVYKSTDGGATFNPTGLTSRASRSTRSRRRQSMPEVKVAPARQDHSRARTAERAG